MNPDPVPEYLDHPDAASHGYDRAVAPPAPSLSAVGPSLMPPAFRHSAGSKSDVVEQLARSTPDGSTLTAAARMENLVGGGSATTESSQQQRRVADSAADGD